VKSYIYKINFEEIRVRVVLLCRYDGSGYHGFQIQPNNNTVQEEIEKALKKINKKVMPTSPTDMKVLILVSKSH